MPERFWEKVDKRGLDECWQWTSWVASDGYGSFYLDRRSQSAHRVAYSLAVGPIPDGLVLDHLCRNRSCVNPSHLEAVTPRENYRRGSGWAGVNARKTHCKRGHCFDEANTAYDSKGRVCRRCKADWMRAKRAAEVDA